MELAKIESTELDKVVINSGLAIQEGEEIKQSYIPFIVQLAEIQEQSQKINFDNPQSIDESIARELRLRTVKIRTGASDLKDERKRIFLLKGNLEQAAYNLIAASCKLTEETFVQVEKAREIAEKKAKEARKIKRIEILNELKYDFTFVDILNMPDEQFDKLVMQLENERDAQIELEKQAEIERLAKIEAERKENERIRLENEKLQAEIKERERLAEIERKKQAEILAKQKAESDRLAKIEAEKQAKIEAQLKAEREAKEKLEREIQAQKDAEIKAKKDAELKAEIERNEKEEAEKKATKAPDKEKLTKWIESINLSNNIPNSISPDSKIIANEILIKFQGFKEWAAKQIETI